MNFVDGLPLLKVNPLFLSWWIDYPNILTFFPSSTPTRLQVLSWSSLIIFSSSTACPPPLCVTEMWPLLANSGRSCLLSKEPSSISVLLITLKQIVKSRSSTVLWRCTPGALLGTNPGIGSNGCLGSNTLTILVATLVWVRHPLRLCMVGLHLHFLLTF
jgi:hypothetical protein